MNRGSGEAFFLITQSDGDVCVHRLTADEVIGYLSVDEETGELTHEPWRDGEDFDSDPAYWPSGKHLIIRGTVVSPRPVTVRYELQ